MHRSARRLNDSVEEIDPLSNATIRSPAPDGCGSTIGDESRVASENGQFGLARVARIRSRDSEFARAVGA